MTVLEDTFNLDILYTSKKKKPHNILLHIFFHPDIKPTLCYLPNCFLSLNFFGIFFFPFFHAICPSVCHLLCLLVIALFFYFSSPNAYFYDFPLHLTCIICVCEPSGTFIALLFVYLDLDSFKASQCRVFSNNISLYSVLLSSKCAGLVHHLICVSSTRWQSERFSTVSLNSTQFWENISFFIPS